ncbi:MAG: sugar phosphate nucleotidyltransferase [Patescibacteria group bacterium]
MGRKQLGRDRLTITLQPELIKALDKTIDGRTIRNRSHAIEYWLTQSLLPPVTKVLILAGGEGVKFRPFTYELPKALLPIKGKPLLEHTFDLLKEQGLIDIILSVGYLGDKIRQYFGDGSRFGVKLTYVDQRKSIHGTAQPVRQARELIGDKKFLLMYGDVIADIDLRDLIEFHCSQKGLVTMALTSVERPTDWGVVNLKGSLITNFAEKPIRNSSGSHLVNAGIYVCEPALFDLIGPKTERLEKEIFSALVQDKKIVGYPFSGLWYDVSTPEIYDKVLKHLN